MPAKKTPAAKSPKSAVRSSGRSRSRSPKDQLAAGDRPVTIDRRRASRRTESGADDAPPAPAVKLERRQKVARRRQIDPTTCERDYSVEEVEFMNAMDEYKRKNGRMFPTCSEVLEVIRGLGYVKLTPGETALLNIEQNFSTEERLDAVTDAVDGLMNETL